MAEMFRGYSGEFLERRGRVSSIIGRDRVRGFGKRIFSEPEHTWGRFVLSFAPWHRIIAFPPAVILEATNHCNLRCRMCLKELSSGGNRGYLGESVFDRVVEEVRRHPGIRFGLCSNRGESMLHPEYLGFLRRAREAVDGIVYTMTNATKMDEAVASAFVEIGIDEVEISVDGARKETYEGIRLGASYDTVIGNILRLIEIRRREGARKPRIMIRSVVMEETRPEIDEYVAFWERTLDPHDVISLQYLMAPGTETPGGRLQARWVERFGGRRDPPCRDLWKCLMVRWNGDIHYCDSMQDASLGLSDNVRDTTIETAWCGDRLRSIRRLHLRGRRREIPGCDDCRCSYSFL